MGGIAKVALAFVLVPRFGYVAEAALLSAYFIVSVALILQRGARELRRSENARSWRRVWHEDRGHYHLAGAFQYCQQHSGLEGIAGAGAGGMDPLRLWVPGTQSTDWEALAGHYGLHTPLDITWLPSRKDAAPL
jgi:hypothetical protein